MEKKTKRVLSFLLPVVLGIAITAKTTVVKADTAINNIGVQYQTHVQSIGWQNWVSDGSAAGTVGKSLRVEASKIKLVNAPAGASIKYQVHVQNVGWQNWVSDGQIAGTVGKSLRVEAIKIVLENMPGYSVQYQAHVQGIGWQKWVSDGQIAGTYGKSLRVEAIRIRIVKISDNTKVNVQYQGHVQKIGWQSLAFNGQISGTEGLSLREEACKIKLINAPAGASIKYQAHVQNIGWQNWVSDGSEAGTNGRSLRLEAIKISLENMPNYSVQYQVHVQNIGWMNWVSNGQQAGTVGRSLRIEAIRIRIVYNIVHPTSVSLNRTTVNLTAGNTETLTAVVAPSNAANKTVTWTSSNAAAATVDNTGKVTAKAAGTTTITATTADGGKTASCLVTVYNVKEYGYVYNPELGIDLKVRSSASITDNIKGYLYNYEKIEILDTVVNSNGNWDKIIYNNNTAYVSDAYIQHYTSPADDVVNIAVSITKQFEVGISNQIGGNFDGEGLSLGYLQWCIGQGTLQPLLNRMDRQYNTEMKTIFGTNYNTMHNMILDTQANQLVWAKSINNLSNEISEPWHTQLVNLSKNEYFIKIEKDAEVYTVKQAMVICDKYKLKTVRGFALAFDIVNQNGSISSAAAESIDAAVQQNPDMTEKNLLTIIANAVASTSDSNSADILSRKMAIVNGAGTVHGITLNLDADFGLSDSNWR